MKEPTLPPEPEFGLSSYSPPSCSPLHTQPGPRKLPSLRESREGSRSQNRRDKTPRNPEGPRREATGPIRPEHPRLRAIQKGENRVRCFIGPSNGATLPRLSLGTGPAPPAHWRARWGASSPGKVRGPALQAGMTGATPGRGRGDAAGPQKSIPRRRLLRWPRCGKGDGAACSVMRCNAMRTPGCGDPLAPQPASRGRLPGKPSPHQLRASHGDPGRAATP